LALASPNAGGKARPARRKIGLGPPSAARREHRAALGPWRNLTDAPWSWRWPRQMPAARRGRRGERSVSVRPSHRRSERSRAYWSERALGTFEVRNQTTIKRKRRRDRSSRPAQAQKTVAGRVSAARDRKNGEAFETLAWRRRKRGELTGRVDAWRNSRQLAPAMRRIGVSKRNIEACRRGSLSIFAPIRRRRRGSAHGSLPPSWRRPPAVAFRIPRGPPHLPPSPRPPSLRRPPPEANLIPQRAQKMKKPPR
jgi:hypothetical protein